jgi:hypothetical protein
MLSTSSQYVEFRENFVPENLKTDLPANLHSTIHHHIGSIERLALLLALVLPEFLHSKHAQLYTVST